MLQRADGIRRPAAGGNSHDNIFFAGLSSVLTAAQLHDGAPGTIGPLLADFTSFAPSATEGTFQSPPVNFPLVYVNDLLAGNTYFEISTANFPGGEIRGQLALVTGVRISGMWASRTARGVLVRWRTEAESQIVGFNLYRERGGPALVALRPFDGTWEEAAVLDGAGLFRVLWQVVLPLTVPSVVATAIVMFVLDWNLLLVPLVLTSGEIKTVPVAMMDFFTFERELDWPTAAAALLVSLVPLAILAGVFHRVLERFSLDSWRTS